MVVSRREYASYTLASAVLATALLLRPDLELAPVLMTSRLLMRPPLLLRRRLVTQVVAVADGWPVLVQERHARETLGGER